MHFSLEDFKFSSIFVSKNLLNTFLYHFFGYHFLIIGTNQWANPDFLFTKYFLMDFQYFKVFLIHLLHFLIWCTNFLQNLFDYLTFQWQIFLFASDYFILSNLSKLNPWYMIQGSLIFEKLFILFYRINSNLYFRNCNC